MFSRSRSSLPGLKWGTRLDSTFTDAPVRGLRPIRESRPRVENAPKPRSSTRPPSASLSEMDSRMVATTRSASRWPRCGLASAIFCTSSDLIMSCPLPLQYGRSSRPRSSPSMHRQKGYSKRAAPCGTAPCRHPGMKQPSGCPDVSRCLSPCSALRPGYRPATRPSRMIHIAPRPAFLPKSAAP